MIGTVNLPSEVEQAFQDATRTKGVSVDALLADVLMSNAPVPEAAQILEWQEEQGIPVLRAG